MCHSFTKISTGYWLIICLGSIFGELAHEWTSPHPPQIWNFSFLHDMYMIYRYIKTVFNRIHESIIPLTYIYKKIHNLQILAHTMILQSTVHVFWFGIDKRQYCNNKTCFIVYRFQSMNGIILIAATNRKDALDP